MSKLKTVLVVINAYVASAVLRQTYLNLAQGFVKSDEIELVTLTELYCAALCLLTQLCCGFEFNHTRGRCLILMDCSYGTATTRGIGFYWNGYSGDQCVMENLALNKPCGQISLYWNDPTYGCDKANDGMVSGYTHTRETGYMSGESYPYWWVDLQTFRSVKEVVIHNRAYNFFRLHNVNVTVGEDLAHLHQCAYHEGPPPNTDPLYLTCDPEVKGRYLQIMNMDEEVFDNFISITEVEVYDCWP